MRDQERLAALRCRRGGGPPSRGGRGWARPGRAAASSSRAGSEGQRRPGQARHRGEPPSDKRETGGRLAAAPRLDPPGERSREGGDGDSRQRDCSSACASAAFISALCSAARSAGVGEGGPQLGALERGLRSRTDWRRAAARGTLGALEGGLADLAWLARAARSSALWRAACRIAAAGRGPSRTARGWPGPPCGRLGALEGGARLGAGEGGAHLGAGEGGAAARRSGARPESSGLARAARSSALWSAARISGLARAAASSGLARAARIAGLARAACSSALWSAAESSGLARAAASAGLARAARVWSFARTLRAAGLLISWSNVVALQEALGVGVLQDHVLRRDLLRLVALGGAHRALGARPDGREAADGEVPDRDDRDRRDAQQHLLRRHAPSSTPLASPGRRRPDIGVPASQVHATRPKVGAPGLSPGPPASRPRPGRAGGPPARPRRGRGRPAPRPRPAASSGFSSLIGDSPGCSTRPSRCRASWSRDLTVFSARPSVSPISAYDSSAKWRSTITWRSSAREAAGGPPAARSVRSRDAQRLLRARPAPRRPASSGSSGPPPARARSGTRSPRSCTSS